MTTASAARAIATVFQLAWQPAGYRPNPLPACALRSVTARSVARPADETIEPSCGAVDPALHVLHVFRRFGEVNDAYFGVPRRRGGPGPAGGGGGREVETAGCGSADGRRTGVRAVAGHQHRTRPARRPDLHPAAAALQRCVEFIAARHPEEPPSGHQPVRVPGAGDRLAGGPRCPSAGAGHHPRRRHRPGGRRRPARSGGRLGNRSPGEVTAAPDHPDRRRRSAQRRHRAHHFHRRRRRRYIRGILGTRFRAQVPAGIGRRARRGHRRRAAGATAPLAVHRPVDRQFTLPGDAVRGVSGG